MKRKHLLGIGLLSAATLLTGCLADTAESATDLVPISLTSVVEAQTSPAGRSATRTTATNLQSDQLPDGEPFYVHFPSGVKQLSGADLTGTTFTADGNGGTSSVTEQPFFARSATSATLHAYHGMSGGTAPVTEATTKFAVALDQSGDDVYKASDLLYAKTSVGKAYPSATAALHFTHKMSKVMVSVTLGAGISSVSAVRIIGGTKAIAITNPTTTDEYTAAYLGDASTDAADQLSDTDGKRIILYSGSYTDKNTALSCAGLIPPQTVTGNFLQVVTSNGTATYSLASKTFAPGESYAYNITVTSASIGITTQITNWTAASDATELVNGGGATLLPEDPGVALASATVGMVIGANGKAYNTIAQANAYTTAAAIIAYKGNGEANSSYNTGLAISLEDVDTYQWKSSYDGTCTAQNSDINTIKSDLGGLAHTATLCSAGHSSHGHDAAVAANGYTSTMAKPANCSTWFLPTIGQWKLIVEAMCGGTGLTTSGQDTYKAANFNKKIRTAYGVSESTTCAGDVQADGYWSSVEYSAYSAWGMNFNYGGAYNDDKGGTTYVRPVLAF